MSASPAASTIPISTAPSPGARMVGSACSAPGAARILARIADDMRVMAAPVLAAAPGDFAGRLDKLLAALPKGEDDCFDPTAVSAMMQAGQGGADSLHRLVMDLHKRLNVMQAALAEETLDGAAAYNLTEADRPLVLAFMVGVNRTARLKFNHPGLAATATRAGGRLVIQNDIGTTDAHVIVIHVEGLTVSVAYTDVHAERLAFFQDMLKSQKVIWEKAAHGRAWRRKRVLSGDRAHGGGGRAGLPRLSDVPRLAPGVPDRLEPRAQAVARVFARAAIAWRCCAGRRTPRSDIAAFWSLAARGWSIRRSRRPPVRRCISATGCATCSAMRPTLEFLRFVFRTATRGAARRPVAAR